MIAKIEARREKQIYMDEALSMWKELGTPRIPFSVGITITNLERWLYPLDRRSSPPLSQIHKVLDFLCDYLPSDHEVSLNPIQEEWIRQATPMWKEKLKDAESKYDTISANYARDMLELMGSLA
jgi:hypothetical protein